MSVIYSMQDQLFIEMSHAIDELQRTRSENRGKVNPGTKAIYREAQAVKWQAKRIARMAYAIEVLESIDPRYEHR
jgi:hypothetical protein